jgi:hypothetical protein
MVHSGRVHHPPVLDQRATIDSEGEPHAALRSRTDNHPPIDLPRQCFRDGRLTDTAQSGQWLVLAAISEETT